MPRIVLLFLVIVFFTQCSPEKTKYNRNGQYQVLLPKTAKQKMKVGYSHLKTLTHLTPVKGKAAELFWGLVDNKANGEPVNAQYINVGSNKYVAEDFLSFGALTLYSFYESFYLQESKSGVANYITWPRKVSFGINMLKNSGNASYLIDYDRTIFYTASGKEKIPTYFNLGVVAHEHFHEYFNAIVTSKLSSMLKPFRHENLCHHQVHLNESNQVAKKESEKGKPKKGVVGTVDGDAPQTKESYLIYSIYRAINEGLADFWAYTYTNDPNSIIYTITNKDYDYRSLKVSKHSNIYDLTYFFQYLENRYDNCSSGVYVNLKMENCLLATDVSYKLGSDIASVLSHIYDADQSKDKQIYFQKKIINLVKKLENYNEQALLEKNFVAQWLQEEFGK